MCPPKRHEEYINGRRVLFTNSGYIDGRCQFAIDCKNHGLDADSEYDKYKKDPTGYKMINKLYQKPDPVATTNDLEKNFMIAFYDGAILKLNSALDELRKCKISINLDNKLDPYCEFAVNLQRFDIDPNQFFGWPNTNTLFFCPKRFPFFYYYVPEKSLSREDLIKTFPPFNKLNEIFSRVSQVPPSVYYHPHQFKSNGTLDGRVTISRSLKTYEINYDHVSGGPRDTLLYHPYELGSKFFIILEYFSKFKDQIDQIMKKPQQFIDSYFENIKEEVEDEVPTIEVLRKIPASLFNFDLFFDKFGKLLEKSDAAFTLSQHGVKAKSVTKGSSNSLIVHNQQTNQYYRISKGNDNSEFVTINELTKKEYEDDKKIVSDEDKIYVTNYTGKRRLSICEFDFGLKPTFEINMRLNGNICFNCETADILRIQKVDLSGLKLPCVFDSVGFMAHDCAMFVALSRHLPGSEFVSFSDMDRRYN